MAEPRRQSPSIETIAASIAIGMTEASKGVAMGQQARSVRKEVTAQGRTARIAKGGGEAVADQAKAVAGGQQARGVRKVATADGRVARAQAGTLVAERPTRARGPNGRFVAKAREKAVKTKLAVGDTARGVALGQGLVDKGMRGMAVASPYMVAASGLVSASSAYEMMRAQGASRTKSAGAAAVAGAPAAATLAAPTLIGRAAPGLAQIVAKAALPLTALAASVGAITRGYDAYKRGESTGKIAGAAALGAADSLSFGLASQVVQRVTGTQTVRADDKVTLGIAAMGGQLPEQQGEKPQQVADAGQKPYRERGTSARESKNVEDRRQETPPDDLAEAGFNDLSRATRDPGSAAPKRIGPAEAQRFVDAAAKFNRSGAVVKSAKPASERQSAEPKPKSGRKPGFGPEARIAAYRARHPDGENVPYGGDPTNAPDYEAPTQRSP